MCVRPWAPHIYDPAAATLSKGLTDHRVRADLEAIRPISSQIPKRKEGMSGYLYPTFVSSSMRRCASRQCASKSSQILGSVPLSTQHQRRLENVTASTANTCHKKDSATSE